MYRATIELQGFVKSIESASVGENTFLVAKLYATGGKDNKVTHHNPKMVIPKGVELAEGDRIKVSGTLKTSAYIGKDGSAKIAEQITYATVEILAKGEPVGQAVGDEAE